MNAVGKSSRRTEADFRLRVAHWAAVIRVKPRQVRLQPRRRKWASCSTRGTVSFSHADMVKNDWTIKLSMGS